MDPRSGRPESQRSSFHQVLPVLHDRPECRRPDPPGQCNRPRIGSHRDCADHCDLQRHQIPVASDARPADGWSGRGYSREYPNDFWTKVEIGQVFPPRTNHFFHRSCRRQATGHQASLSTGIFGRCAHAPGQSEIGTAGPSHTAPDTGQNPSNRPHSRSNPVVGRFAHCDPNRSRSESRYSSAPMKR